jgi:hypothetical protein
MAETVTIRSEADDNQCLAEELELWKTAKDQSIEVGPATRPVDVAIIGSRALHPVEFGPNGEIYYDC